MTAIGGMRVASPPGQGEGTRARILRAAAELIAEVGWGSVTTRLVAERAGANNAAVNYHFSTKAALLRSAAVAAVEEAVAEPVARMAAASSLREALEAWAGWVEGIDPRSTTATVLLETMLQAPRDAELCSALRGTLAAARQVLGERLEAEHGAGPRDGDTAATAALLAAALDGLALHTLVDPQLDLRAAAARLAALAAQDNPDRSGT